MACEAKARAEAGLFVRRMSVQSGPENYFGPLIQHRRVGVFFRCHPEAQLNGRISKTEVQLGGGALPPETKIA